MLPKRRAVCCYQKIQLISYFSVCLNDNMKDYQRKERVYSIWEKRNGKVMIFFFYVMTHSANKPVRLTQIPLGCEHR